MTPIRPNRLVTVTMAIALLAIEAVTALGVARAIAWWDGPRPATLARAGATAWRALSRHAMHATVETTLPMVRVALRTTDRVERAVATPRSSRRSHRDS